MRSGRPQCSYNCVTGELKVIYLLIKFKKVMASKILKIKISQRKAGEKIKKRARWSTKQTSVLVKCLKEHSPKLESARASEFRNIIRAEVNRHSPEKTLKKCKDKIRNLRDRSKKAKEKNKKSGASPAFFLYFLRTLTKFSQREISSTSLVLLKREFHCPKKKEKMSV